MSRLTPLAPLLIACVGGAADPVTIPDTEQWDVRSKAGPDYRVFVAAPTGKPPAGGWPVLYLTDGNLNFLVLHAAVRRIAVPAVVVGVGYTERDTWAHLTRRSFDLTSAQSEAFRKR